MPMYDKNGIEIKVRDRVRWQDRQGGEGLATIVDAKSPLVCRDKKVHGWKMGHVPASDLTVVPPMYPVTQKDVLAEAWDINNDNDKSLSYIENILNTMRVMSDPRYRKVRDALDRQWEADHA